MIKGAVSRDFLPQFFYKSNPSGFPINRLKWFFLKIHLREDIRIFREYLSKNEFKSITILSGAQLASIHEIQNGKNLVTLPL